MKNRLLTMLKNNKKKIISLILATIIAMAGLNMTQEAQDNFVDAVSEVIVVE